MALAELFPPQDYGYHLTLRRGNITAFFAPSAQAPSVLAERRRWLESAPEHYVVDPADEREVWVETADLLQTTAVTPSEIGGRFEPDLVILRRDASGVFRLSSGVVVFPTGWSLPEKTGLTLAETHGVVPGLNPAIGAAINRLLDRLKPGQATLRDNWGLTATPELNLHPAQPRPRLQADTPPENVWLRVEHQILTVLPVSGAVLFGIRVALHPLTAILDDPAARVGLHRALTTMPAPMAGYKGLAAIMPALHAWTAPA